jgi:hypothetical protein
LRQTIFPYVMLQIRLAFIFTMFSPLRSFV